MLEGSGIAEQMNLGEVLAEHVIYRIDEIADSIEFIASTRNDTNRAGWDSISVVGLLQAPEPGDPVDHFRRIIDAYRNFARPVSKVKFRTWCKAAEALASVSDAVRQLRNV
ncbi:hypothetical protein [Lentzea sp. CA-135723]|uniref:hypothetical protein n=1 Tax=Lentzea sp. CA-135723 TaxID=3239950 RepID=UPI003D89CD8B